MTNEVERDITGLNIVVAVNVHGVVEAFGPYDDDEAGEVAEFASRLVPTWRIVLADDEFGKGGSCVRYGIDGTSIDQPRRLVDHPTLAYPLPQPESENA